MPRTGAGYRRLHMPAHRRMGWAVCCVLLLGGQRAGAEDAQADAPRLHRLQGWTLNATPEREDAQADAPPWDPRSAYVERRVQGWLVLVHQQLALPENEALARETLELLEDHLYRIRRVVPEPALGKLQAVPIWVELAHPRHPCMCYHISADWLREHGMNPEKAGAVELANCRNFLSWTHDQPWMVLHELAHAYHHQVLGLDHAGLQACYQRAVADGRYEAVLRINGRRERAYALNNVQEYFAEATEAFFGTNDFYPFVRAELKEHDPELYALLHEVWGTAER